MSIFDEKVYTYLTQPDNWEVAKEISEKMTLVKGRLIKDFWETIKVNIQTRSEFKEWKLKETPNSTLGITYPSWNGLFSIEFGKIDGCIWFGIWCDSGSPKMLPAIYETAGEELKAIDKRMKKDEQNWIAWYYVGDDFNQWSTLDKILPSGKERLIENYLNMLINTKEKAKPIIDKILSEMPS